MDGRAFTPEDDRPGVQPGAVVISEGLARTASPDGSAIGERFTWGDHEGIIVGVAADIRDEEMLGAASVLAALPPGRRAARVDPMVALRSE